MNKSAKIFLSHSSKDKDFVRRLANDLKSNNVPVWFDEWELQVGDSLNQKISDGISESGWLAVVISINSINSKWVEKELNAAFTTELEKKQVFVLPIVIEDCEIPLFLRDKLFADFRTDYSSGLKTLLKRLIPEKSVFPTTTSKELTHKIQRPPSHPRPEEQLLNIVDVRIEGRHPQYSGLFDIRFILDKQPDENWHELFNHPTSFSISVHPAKVYGNEIHWMASEVDITKNKHWIYDWVDDANKRYLPIIQTKITKEEERYRNSQLENAKVAGLESLLKGGREETLIILTDEVIVGKCSLRLDGCSAPNIPGPISQVNFENKGFIHTCFDCLQKQIDDGKWKTK